MKLRLIAATLALSTTAALAQTTPGDQFMQSWDLDQDGIATLAELREMRGMVFNAFDAEQDDYLDAEDYVMFDEARQNDVDNYVGEARAQMQGVADAMTLTNSDTDGDGRVSREEFLAGAEPWFASLDTNGDDGITLEDFAQ